MAKSYDPKNIKITVGGFPISGFADGSFVTVERNEDMWTLQVGADGEAARSKSNNRSGRLTVSLLQTSASNDVLSAFAQADDVGGAAQFPVSVEDALGNSLFFTDTAWVKKMAPAPYGKEAAAREWVLETDVLVAFVGGNS